jgi:hypothetical protein
MILAHFTQSLRQTFPTRASEWALGLTLFLWSGVLTFNEDLFLINPSFVALSRVAPQPTWAILCMMVGGGRLMMLLVNGAWRRSPHLRAFAAFLSCFFWFEISVGLWQSSPYGIGTGLAVYPVLFLLDVYNVFRASGDAGASDRSHSGDRNGTDT